MDWRYRIEDAWWTIVARLNRKAYLRHFAADPIDDRNAPEELLCLETEELTRRGAKVNVWVRDIPLPEGITRSGDPDAEPEWPWKFAADYSEYIPSDILSKFRKLVEDAEYEKARRRREGRELWVKYFTAIAATLAALASLANLYFSNRKK